MERWELQRGSIRILKTPSRTNYCLLRGLDIANYPMIRFSPLPFTLGLKDLKRPKMQDSAKDIECMLWHPEFKGKSHVIDDITELYQRLKILSTSHVW